MPPEQMTSPTAAIAAATPSAIPTPAALSNSAPIALGADAIVKPAQSVSLASLLSATDPDGDDIVRWAIVDKTGGQSGRLVIDGEVIGPGEYVELTVAQLGDARFVGGAPWSFDFLEIRAFDGLAWSEVDPFQITTMGSLGTGGILF